MADKKQEEIEEVAPAPEAVPVTEPTPTAQPHHTPPHTPASGPTNGLAIASMIVGVVAFVTGWIPFWGLLAGAAAVVLGVIALKKPAGKGLSITGIITGGLAVLTSLLFTVIFFVTLATGSVILNEAANQLQEQSSQSQQMIDAKKDFAKGETAVFGPYGVKVNDVKRGYVPEDSDIKADEGNEYVVVNLTVTNISEDENKYVGPYTFSLTEAGQKIEGAFVEVKPELTAENLHPGESVTGNLVFEVTKGSTDLKLQLETTVFTQNYDAKKLVYTLVI